MATPDLPLLIIASRKRAMIESEPEVYQNESKFGPITGIPVGATWSSRQVFVRYAIKKLSNR